MENKQLKCFNLNDYVFVKLNDYGEKIWEYQNADFLMEAPKLKLEKDGYLKIQLWELMRIYGKFLHNGSMLPFERAEMFFEGDQHD